MLKKTIGMAGFTLAEVLITLGIIGVVAAMTMPTLINSTQGAQYKTAYKKALSVLSQAVVMNIALEDYDLSQTVAGTNATADAEAAGAQSIYELFKNRMNVVKVSAAADFPDTATNGDADYYKIVDTGNADDEPDPNHFTDAALPDTWITGGATNQAWPAASTFLFMNDGIAFIFDNTQSGCAAETATTEDAYCLGYIDVNGQKGPNRIVECDGTDAASTLENEKTDEAICVVSNPTDIYPVMFYDQSIVPATAAGRAVLYAK